MTTDAVDRERFQALMESEGMPREISKRILRWANTYQRLAVLACNGDRRPYVPCPASYVERPAFPELCLCDRRYWDDDTAHEKIPPVAIEQARAERMIREWCGKAVSLSSAIAGYKFVPIFQRDPRGACTKLRVPSGRTDDGNHEGICVPTRRY